jgi:predicted ATPase
MRQLFRLLEMSQPSYATSYSFAPIRSKPRRTYDELSEEYTPEGDHIPTLLARLLRQEPSSADGVRVQKALLRFGKESGLFKKINVKKLGKKVTDPFQVQVAAAGPPVNLTDVGYGVSQALPIIVQSVLTTTSRVLLMQQPEVHLHPRAQAALGSFFSELAADEDRIIVMETHSDYLVDRVRQEVAKGTISPERVLILFFNKPQLDTSVFAIHVDAQGNIEDAPQEYRAFFLQEELNLFSRTEV